MATSFTPLHLPSIKTPNDSVIEKNFSLIGLSLQGIQDTLTAISRKLDGIPIVPRVTGGVGVAGRVAYWTSATSLGNGDLYWDDTAKKLSIGPSAVSDIRYSGSTLYIENNPSGEAQGDIVIGGNFTVSPGSALAQLNGDFFPSVDTAWNLGSPSFRWRDAYVRNASVGGTLGVTGLSSLTSANISGLTASLAVFTDASKNLVSNSITGTGNVVMSASPTLTGTISAANQSLSGTLLVSGQATITLAPIVSSLTASLPVFSNGSKALVSNTMTGTGSVVMSASPTLTGTITAAAMTLSSTLDVSGVVTAHSNISFTGNLGIIANTADGADNSSTSVSGGGAAASDTRGGYITTYGNEATETGSVRIVAGDVSGGVFDVRTGGGISRLTINRSGAVNVPGLSPSLAVFTDPSKNLISNTITGTGNVVMSASPTLTGTIAAASMTLSGTLGVTGAATLSSTLSVTGVSTLSADLVLSASIGLIKSDTADGSDTKSIRIVGGGYTSGSFSARGGQIRAYGNEASGGLGGLVYIQPGSVSQSGVQIALDPSVTFGQTFSVSGASGAIIVSSVGSVDEVHICDTTGTLQFFNVGVTGQPKQTVTGSRGGNAALASLLTALSQYGLITNSTT